MLEYVEHPPDPIKEKHMKHYEVRVTIDVGVTFVVHAPDEESAHHWYELPQQSVLVQGFEVDWNRAWDVAEYDNRAFVALDEKDIRGTLEHIVTELRRNAFLPETPNRDTAVTVEFTEVQR